MLYDRLKYRVFHFISFYIEFSSKKRYEEARRYPVKRSRKQILCAIFVFAIIAAAYGCRTLARLDIGGKEYNFIRAGLYLLLFSAWGFYLDRRIIQKQVLHYLRMISALIIICLSLRTMKYELVSDPTASRYLWYLYYLPMLFIPLSECPECKIALIVDSNTEKQTARAIRDAKKNGIIDQFFYGSMTAEYLMDQVYAM